MEEIQIPDHISLNGCDKAILRDLIEHTADVPSNIGERNDYDRTYVHQRCTRLTEHRILRNRGNGVYQIHEQAIDPQT